MPGLGRFLLLATVLLSANACGDDDRQTAIKWPVGNFVIPVRPPASNADPANPAGPNDVITQRNNNLRTGTVLDRNMNQAAVSGRFGWLASLPVDGAFWRSRFLWNRCSSPMAGAPPSSLLRRPIGSTRSTRTRPSMSYGSASLRRHSAWTILGTRTIPIPGARAVLCRLSPPSKTIGPATSSSPSASSRRRPSIPP